MDRTERLRYFQQQYLDKIVQLYRPMSVWLWGSLAYGQPHSESDIDLIVVSDAFRGIKFTHRMAHLLRQVGASTDRKVGAIDVLCYTPDEFADKLRQVSVIRRAIEEGIRLV
jgi:predicted nucleotidyltransferase